MAPALMRLLLVIALVALATLVSVAPAAAQTAKVDGPIPSDAVGSGSRDYPFGAAVDDLAAHGYVEQEFFFSGTTPAGDYTSRMVVRRPSDPARFSGTAIAEWTNVTNHYDLDALWLRSSEHLMRRGDAYVTIDVQADGVVAKGTGLKAWSPKRYAKLHLPAGATAGGALLANANDAGMFDIYGAALRAIREGGGLLGGLRPKLVLGTGTSQSALYLYLYEQSVDQAHRLADGYLITAASTSTLGQNGPTSVNLPVAGNRVPIMWLNTETDTSYRRSPDTPLFRLWEVAGTTHLDWDGRQVQAAFVRRDFGTELKPLTNCAYRPFSRIHFRDAQNAALDALEDWVRTGAPPASQPGLTYDSDGRVVRDGYGNALGGVRLPAMDVPISTESRENTGACKALYGRSVPFGPDVLRLLYPTHADYVAKVRAAATRALATGVIVPDDAAQTVRDADAAPVPTAAAARACGSRRVVVLRFPRRVDGRAVRRVTVKVGSRAAVRVRVRSRTLRVPLVGHPAHTVVVKVTLRLAGGRSVTSVRRFRTCAPS